MIFSKKKGKPKSQLKILLGDNYKGGDNNNKENGSKDSSLKNIIDIIGVGH